MEKKITKTDEKMEARERVLKKLEELKKTALEAVRKKKKDDNKECWFDLQKCFYSLELKGFEDARRECGNCCQLPIERFFNIMESVFGDSKFIEDKKSRAIEDGIEKGRAEEKEEAEEEAEEECTNVYNEISEELDGLLTEIEEKTK